MAARPRILLAIALAAASAVVLAACGSDEDAGEIPADTAAQMLAALDEAQAAQEATPPECDTIAESASTVSNTASQLPDSPVRGAVIAAAENLHELAQSDECAPSTTGPQGPEEDETTTTTTTPTTTTTEETTTTPEEDNSGTGGDTGGGTDGDTGNGNGGNGGGPPPQPGNEGGGGLGGGDTGGEPPPETGGTGGGTGSD
jgi:hypothetical protein